MNRTDFVTNVRERACLFYCAEEGLSEAPRRQLLDFVLSQDAEATKMLAPDSPRKIQTKWIRGSGSQEREQEIRNASGKGITVI